MPWSCRGRAGLGVGRLGECRSRQQGDGETDAQAMPRNHARSPSDQPMVCHSGPPDSIRTRSQAPTPDWGSAAWRSRTSAACASRPWWPRPAPPGHRCHRRCRLPPACHHSREAARPTAGGMSVTAPSIRITSYGAPAGQPAASGPETRLTPGASSAKQQARLRQQRRIILQCRHPGATGREQRGPVAGPCGDHQRPLALGDRGQLHQPGDHHRFQQDPAAAERDVLVGVGERRQAGRHEALARQPAHCREDPRIGNLVRADLAVHHVVAGFSEAGSPMSIAGRSRGVRRSL